MPLCDIKKTTKCPDPHRYTCGVPECSQSIQRPCAVPCNARKCCVPRPPPPPCPDPSGPVDNQVKKIREACSRRGPVGLRDLGRMFCLYDDVDGGCGPARQITCVTMKRTLVDFGVQLCDADMDKLCEYLNRCGDGQLVTGDLFGIIRPKLSRARAEAIEAAYRSIDTDADGCISLTDMIETYDYEHHPKFLNGDWTREQVIKSFVDDFRQRGAYCGVVHGDAPCERISKQEFVDYYLGHSTIVDKDVHFDYMLRHSWRM